MYIGRGAFMTSIDSINRDKIEVNKRENTLVISVEI
jgi:hypothetical protein